ncbi:SYN3 family protein [Megaselia abdita]
MNFSSFKSSFTSNVNYLKRRYTSGDLSSECDENGQMNPPPIDNEEKSEVSDSSKSSYNEKPKPTPPTELELNVSKSVVRGTSAPVSPTKTRESLLQRVQSLTGAAREQGASIMSAAVQSATRPTTGREKYITLLVIDDQQTDWTKYFKGKRLAADYDIRVEQAQFNEISVTSGSDTGCVVSMNIWRNGTKVPRSFKPDFVLIRQPIKNGNLDFTAILTGFAYCNLPTINSIQSIYQFQDKSWSFARLIQLQKRLGRDSFNLIDQSFYTNTNDLISWSKFPCVVKIGTCHGGAAMIRFENQMMLLDYVGLLTIPFNKALFCTIEPFIDSKYDIHVQKIGNNYKAFMRKSISGNWKTNQGSAMLEQMPVSDKHKMWIEEISKTFGGLVLCELSFLVDRNGTEYLHSFKDSSFPLIGDSQEEDRKNIVEIVSSKMQENLYSTPGAISRKNSMDSSQSTPLRQPPLGGPPPIPERISPAIGSIGRLSSRSSISEQPTVPAPTLNLGRRDSQSSATADSTGPTQPEDTEDTMKNLRKTFAGIFGDM